VHQASSEALALMLDGDGDLVDVADPAGIASHPHQRADVVPVRVEHPDAAVSGRASR
jgi:hypothetical protein